MAKCSICGKIIPDVPEEEVNDLEARLMFQRGLVKCPLCQNFSPRDLNVENGRDAKLILERESAFEAKKLLEKTSNDYRQRQERERLEREQKLKDEYEADQKKRYPWKYPEEQEKVRRNTLEYMLGKK